MAAFELFKKQDFTRVTTKKIAQEAGVNEITIFRKFKTKYLLFQAVLDKYKLKIMKILNSIKLIDEEMELKPQLYQLLEQFIENFNDHMPILFTLFPPFFLDSFEFLLSSYNTKEILGSFDYKIAGRLFFGYVIFLSIANQHKSRDVQSDDQDSTLWYKKMHQQAIDLFLV